MKPTEDPDHEGNDPKYHTGALCIVADCNGLAGTWWSPHWCQQHNHERLERVSLSLKRIQADHKKHHPSF